MRTIKFRGYGIVEKKWFYGNLVEGNAGRYITDAYYEEGQGDMIRYDPIQTKTIGQFTGLLDKNGKEIYEGDVIQGGRNNGLLIKYDENEASYFAYILPISEFPRKRRVYQNWINKYNKVVIGNIHDNPELMKS